MKRILAIIPAELRRRSLGVTASVLGRALLNLIGVAALVSLLALALDPGAGADHAPGGVLRAWTGIASERGFFVAVCGAVVLVTLAKGLAVRKLTRIEERYLIDLYRILSRKLFVTYHDRGLPFIERTDSTSLARDVNALTRLFTTGVVRPAAALLADATLLTMILAAAALYRPVVTLLPMLLLTVGWLCIRRIRRRIARCGAIENRIRRRKGRLVVEAFRGYADLELCGAFAERLAAFDRMLAAGGHLARREADLRLLPPLIVECSTVIVLALLASASFGQPDAPLLFGLYAMVALRMMPAVRSLLNNWNTLGRNRTVIETLNQALHGDPSPHDRAPVRRPFGAEAGAGGRRSHHPGPETHTVNNFGGSMPATGSVRAVVVEAPPESGKAAPLPFERTIEFRHLSFRYPDAGEDLLHDLNFTLRKGERLGICGASGAGKSTLLRLLAGLYEPTAGEIRIDGRPLEAGNRLGWQQHIGYVAQFPFLVDGTLAENIAPGRANGDIDPQRMAEVLAAAHLETFVTTLPQGLQTQVGEGGIRLSGGQRQRLALARALYRQADLLLLDEATASLDGRTETEVLSALEELSLRRPGMTICAVAHHEAALARCGRRLQLGAGLPETKPLPLWSIR